MKKMNKDAIVIKDLLMKGWSKKKIEKFLKSSQQKVNYWVKHEIKIIQIRKPKLKNICMDRIIKRAKNKHASSMSCRKIVGMINGVLAKKMKLIKKIQLF